MSKGCPSHQEPRCFSACQISRKTSLRTDLTSKKREMKNRGLKNRVVPGSLLDFCIPAIYSLLVNILPEASKRQSSLVGDGKRPENIGVFVRGHRPDPLRRNGPDAAFLSMPASAMAAATRRDHPPPRWRLPASRPALGDALCSDRWTSAGQPDRNFAVQWCVPFAVESGSLSVCLDAASFFAAHRTASGPPTGTAARPIAPAVVRFPRGLLGVDLRFGQCGAYRLRRAARRSPGVQPQKEASPLLSSAAVLRIPTAGAFAPVTSHPT